MTDDTGQSSSSQDTSSVPTPPDRPLANPVDSTWPDSTKMANDTPADSLELANQVATDSGQVTPSSDRPDSTNLANTQNPADSSSTNLANDQTANQTPQPIATVEEKPVEAPVVPEPPKEEILSQVGPAEIGQSESTASSNLANPPDLPNDIPVVQSPPPEEKPPEQPISSETPPPQVDQSEPSESTSTSDLSLPAGEAGNPSNLTNLSPISVSLPDNQAPQVQSEAPNDASNIDTEKTSDQLANLKPEPPEQPQEAPLANNDSQNSGLPAKVSTKEGPKSFGDLLSLSAATPAPSSPPSDQAPVSSIPPSSPVPPISPTSTPISFGDLLDNLPSINIEPIERPAPPPATSSIPPTTDNQQPINQNSQPPPSPSPVIDQNEMQKQFEEKSKAKLVENRIKANQARSQKKENHLHKIMELARNTKTITNTDIQRLLHVSQSTATNYLAELTSGGMLKREGIRGGAKYTL